MYSVSNDICYFLTHGSFHHQGMDVLNGIAWDSEQDRLFGEYSLFLYCISDVSRNSVIYLAYRLFQ